MTEQGNNICNGDIKKLTVVHFVSTANFQSGYEIHVSDTLHSKVLPLTPALLDHLDTELGCHGASRVVGRCRFPGGHESTAPHHNIHSLVCSLPYLQAINFKMTNTT
jgi:hypothetical protein